MSISSTIFSNNILGMRFGISFVDVVSVNEIKNESKMADSQVISMQQNI